MWEGFFYIKNTNVRILADLLWSFLPFLSKLYKEQVLLTDTDLNWLDGLKILNKSSKNAQNQVNC